MVVFGYSKYSDSWSMRSWAASCVVEPSPVSLSIGLASGAPSYEFCLLAIQWFWYNWE